MRLSHLTYFDRKLVLTMGSTSVGLDLLRQLFKVWISQPLIPFFCIIAPPYFCLLEEPHHADDSKMLAENGQALLANLFECHGLRIHSYITSKSQSNGFATRTCSC